MASRNRETAPRHGRHFPRPSSARELALQALCRVELDGAYGNAALSALLTESALEPRERRQATAYFYRTLEHLSGLDACLAPFSRRPLAELDAVLLSILRLAAAQIYFMDSVPDRAACATAVDLARKYGHEGQARYANGLLRALLRERPPFPTSGAVGAGVSETLYRAIDGWLDEDPYLRRLATQDGSACQNQGKHRAFWGSLSNESPVVLRANNLRGTAEELCRRLEKEGCEPRLLDWPTGAIELASLGDHELTALSVWREGNCIAQGRAAQLPVALCPPRTGERCLDVCAAPGGKTLQLAERVGAAVPVTAWELYPARLEKLRENAARLGCQNIFSVARDATSDPNIQDAEAYDYVLVDAPCSSLGLLGEKPELRWNGGPADDSLLHVQAAILRNAARTLKRGGTLVYCTCTLNPAENEKQVTDFLASPLGEDFYVSTERLSLPHALRRNPYTSLQLSEPDPERPGLRFYPHTHACEGFYLCVLQRKAAVPERRTDQRPYIYDLDTPAWQAALADLKLPNYRLAQIQQWLDCGMADSAQMTNLPLSLRRALDQRFRFASMTPLDILCSKLDDTVKYVFRLDDGNVVETVAMSYQTGRSVCVSSQAGCRMGCIFCASAKAGFARNLTAGEMLAQVRFVAEHEGCRVHSVVVMGIGEPFENYEPLRRFLHTAHDPAGLGLSYRHITVSTCGLVPEMLKFAEEAIPVNLAVSLHAPDDALRCRLMPIAKRYPLDALMEACRYYISKSGRRLTFEYALMRGVNDRPEQAKALAELTRGLLCHINLIPLNPFPDGSFRRSQTAAVKRFQQTLQEMGRSCTLRRALGRDIMAACGQLRRRTEA